MLRNDYVSLKEVLLERNIKENLDDYKELKNILLGNIKSLAYQHKIENINILEIGFNNGIYSDFFLRHTNEKSNIVSFDSCNTWLVMPVLKNFIDEKYPSRHTLILGKTSSTLPAFHELCKLKRFDLIFVNGKTNYEELKEDLDNIERFCKEETIIVLNNVCKKGENMRYYTTAPTQLWEDLLTDGKVIELGSHENEEGGHGCVWGKFVMEISA